MASFPKIKNSSFTADKGVNAVSRVVNDEFNWLFRRVPGESDYGIDAYFEVVTDGGYVTGQSVAAQVKSGSSFFKTETPSSYIFYGERKHLNYYANLPQPVIIVIYDTDASKGYWTLFDLEKVEGTPKGWKIAIPKRSVFNISAKVDLLKLVGPHADHSEVLAQQWAINDMIGSGSYLLYMVDKLDIISKNTDDLSSFIRRICLNETLERAVQGKVFLSISGYDMDSRELFEIPEVREWFLVYTKLDFPWFYLLETVHGGHWLKLDFVIHARGKRVANPVTGIINVEVQPPKAIPWLMRNFRRLNSLTDKLEMSIEDNKNITFAVRDLLQIPGSD